MASLHDETVKFVAKETVKFGGPLAGALVLVLVAVSALGYGRFLNENVQAVFDGIVLFMLGAGVVLSILSLSRMAKPLGYSAGYTAASSQTLVADGYDGANVLSPLENARFRILEHIVKLRNNSVFNLYIGLGIAVGGIAILFSAILQIEQFYIKDKYIFDTNSFVFFALLPKLSITLLVQIFSYFFLAMYRSNQNDIKYFQNEITFIDSLATAVIAAQRPGSAPNMKLVLAALSKNERNRVMKKGDKLIVSTDEAEFIRALSVLSQATNRADKD